MVDLTCELTKPATYQEICQTVKAAAAGRMRNIVEYTEDDIVSSDVRGNRHTCIFDAKTGMQLDSTFVKLVCWYDNECGFSSKLLDLVNVVAG